MYIQNAANQSIAVAVVSATTGGTMTGTTGFAGYRILDGGSQAPLTGTFTDYTNGQYTFTFSQADINGVYCKYLFTMTGMVPWPVTIKTVPAAIITSGTGTDQISVSSGKVLLQATQTGVTIPTVTTVGTLTTYTGNTLQTGDSYARIGNAGAGLTAIGDTRLTHLDADVSSRLAPSGTLALVTSVTNPVGVTGDFSATMKTSITTAATAATPTVAAVTGNVGGNVVGTVGSVVTKTGYSLATAPPTAEAIATAILTDTSDQSTVGSLGKLTSLLTTSLNGTSVFTSDALANAPSGGGGGSGPTASQIATAVWQDTTAADFTTEGSPGYRLVTSGVPLTSTYDAAKTAAQSGDAMTLDLTQVVPTSNTAQTVGDALNAARSEGFGGESVSGTTYTKYAADGTTAIRVFTLTLDDDGNPIGRS